MFHLVCSITVVCRDRLIRTHCHLWSAANGTRQLGHPAPAKNKLQYLLGMFHLPCSMTVVCRDRLIHTHAISLISSKRRRSTRVSSASKEQTPLHSGYVVCFVLHVPSHLCVVIYSSALMPYLWSAANDGTGQLGYPAPAKNKPHYLLDGQNVTATRKNGIFTITRRPNNRFGNDQQIKFFISDICESVTVLSDVLSVKSFKIFKDVILFESNHLFRKIRSNKIQ